MSDRSRTAAVKAGELTYLGSPCRQGHEGWRYVTNKCCITCQGHRQREARRKRVEPAERQTDARSRNALLLLWYPQEFERWGWRRAGTPRYEEG